MRYSDQQAKTKPDKEKFPWWYFSRIYGTDGTPYMTRIAVKRLRLHIFHRGDKDPDCHDHPWGFWTFPLVSYVEEVIDFKAFKTREQTVQSFRWHYRPATHAHRVLHAVGRERPIVTIVWADNPSRQWGFWRREDIKTFRWVYWKEYLGI